VEYQYWYSLLSKDTITVGHLAVLNTNGIRSIIIMGKFFHWSDQSD